jgi:hypothetical protein
MNVNNEELEDEFKRQVFLCSGISKERMVEIIGVEEKLAPLSPKRVACASIVSPLGLIHYGPTHALCGVKEGKQGFADQNGKFLSRSDAWKVAFKAGQIVWHDEGRGVLMSEYLYPKGSV